MTTTEIAAADPLDVLLEREDRHSRLKRALRSMGSREQQVLLLHEAGGRPLGTVARRLGISTTQASESLDRARAQLAHHKCL